MIKYECTRCKWTGEEQEFVQVAICPDCSTGHHPARRLLETAEKGVLSCPACSWSGKEADFEPECPKCGNQYLKQLK